MMSLDHGEYIPGHTFTYGIPSKPVFDTAGKIPELVLSYLEDLCATRREHFLRSCFSRLMEQRSCGFGFSKLDPEKLLNETLVFLDYLEVVTSKRNRHGLLLIFLARHLPSLLKIPPLKLKKTKTAETVPASLLLGNKKIQRGSSLGQLVSSVQPEKTNNDEIRCLWRGWATP